MVLKINWEQDNNQYQRLPESTIISMIHSAYPQQKLISYQWLVGGCSNLNVKFFIEGYSQPQILRIYLRNSSAAYREQNIAKLIRTSVPVPQTTYIGKIEPYHFAIIDFAPGISLRDLLLSNLPFDLSSIMYKVGEILAKINSYSFEKSGFFNQSLEIETELTPRFILDFLENCLQHYNVISTLGLETISQIRYIFKQSNHLLYNPTERHLVHGDFDPANILVHQVNGVWEISAVLDWEFAFSGSILCDIANMLRYAHKMPILFKSAFIKSLEHHGIVMPVNCDTLTSLLNILALVDCLQNTKPELCPKRCQDIQELIKYFLELL